MKTIALDIGDAWIGIAISDALGISCRPYETVPAASLHDALQELFSKERIETVVVGYPLTLKGTESEQTRKVIATKEELAVAFPSHKWVLWDERLSSKRAQAQQATTRTKEAKLKEHAIAASFILQTYLDSLAFARSTE